MWAGTAESVVDLHQLLPEEYVESYAVDIDSVGNIVGTGVTSAGDEHAVLWLALLPGDVTRDGFVGGADLTEILTYWGMSGVSWDDGDVEPYPNGDGFIGGGDYTEVLTYWGTGTPPEAIPEPATLGLLLIGGLALLRRRQA